MDSAHTIALSIALGIGLAAASGFRVFLPMFALSIAGYSGYVHLNEHFAWLASGGAVATLGVATVIEVLAYYFPVVDNLLDTITTPMAMIAGAVLAAAVISDLPPWVRWATAIIAGGGVAGVTQGVTAIVRAKSTAFTAGLGNPLVSTFELLAATVIALLALLAPFIAIIAVIAICWFTVRMVKGFLRSPKSKG